MLVELKNLFNLPTFNPNDFLSIQRLVSEVLGPFMQENIDTDQRNAVSTMILSRCLTVQLYIARHMLRPFCPFSWTLQANRAWHKFPGSTLKQHKLQ